MKIHRFKKTLILVSVIFCIIIAIGYEYISSSKRILYPLFCNAQIIVSKDNKELSAHASFYITHTTGFAYIRGSLQEGKQLSDISRGVNFKVTQTDANLNFTSIRVSKSEGDNTPLQELQTMLPPFYFIKDRQVDFLIQRDTNAGYIFFIAQTPVFYCSSITL